MPKIAIIAGDGIGVDVTREAVKVLNVVNDKFSLGLQLEELDYGAERYLRDGVTLPSGEMERFRKEVDAIYLGALGDPRIPDMRHGREILLAMRFELDLYINLRPVRCLAEHLCPLKNKGPADIDFTVFRENTEGLYVGVGGIFKKGTPDEVAINEDINTRKGVERIIRAAFEFARKRGKKQVTMSDKSNAVRFAHDLWVRTFEAVAKEYPGIDTQHLYVDALAMQMLKRPEQFEVIVTNNMFGDIVTDIGAQLQGGLGMAASGNINPEGVSLFEPVHGSAPKYAGKNVANPIAAILTAEMMLDHLGMTKAASAIGKAVQKAIDTRKVTREAGGDLGTQAVGDFIAESL
ncbi:MAG: 3-isopropylmalate dehydrogenase [Myxococcota bacterium]